MALCQLPRALGLGRSSRCEPSVQPSARSLRGPEQRPAMASPWTCAKDASLALEQDYCLKTGWHRCPCPAHLCEISVCSERSAPLRAETQAAALRRPEFQQLEKGLIWLLLSCLSSDWTFKTEAAEKPTLPWVHTSPARGASLSRQTALDSHHL